MPGIYNAAHEEFRDSVRSFFENELEPHHHQWETDGIVPRDVWRKAGEAGLLCFDAPREYGGRGIDDFRYNMVLTETQTRLGLSGPGFTLHTDVVVPYIIGLGTDEQKRRWLPNCIAGKTITAIAMTEPSTGSDLQNIGTSAIANDDHYVLNGSKTFISNGINADLVIVVAKTNPHAGAKGISLLVVERGMEGFERGRTLDKIGMRAQDTAELFFDNVKVPKSNLLGVEGKGFAALMRNLRQERLIIGAQAVAACEAIVDTCIELAQSHRVFQRPTFDRFAIAEMATEARVARAFLNEAVLQHLDREFEPAEAAMIKWWSTELQNKLANRAIELFGESILMEDHFIARSYADSRITTIFGGTSEIQKEIVCRSLGV